MIESNTTGLSQYMFPDRRGLGLFAKLFSLTLLTLAVLVFGVVRYGDQRAENSTLESLETEERQAAIAMSSTVQQTLFNTTASLQYLVLLIERSLAASSDVRGVQSIEQTLLDFSNTHPAFDQLRFINTEGLEVVRVDASSNGSFIVPSSELQDKSSRDYFKRGIALSQGKVVVVPVEFNEERGVIEYPLKPVIRLAMPVYDRNDSKVGVAIINYKAKVLLDRLYAMGKVARGNPNIISLRGRWLMETAGSQPERYTINALEDLGFSQRMPEEWRLMGEQIRGVFRTENGFFSYRVLLPSRLGEGPSVRSVSWTVPKSDSGEEGGWIVMSHVPQRELESIISSNQLLPPATRLMIAFLVWIVAWLLALQICMNRLRISDLKTSANSDDLTGLINRGEFDRNMQRAISLAERTKRSMGVVYLDVNDFKALNDEYGHASGDKVLVAIGERLAQSCRDSDVAARLGGDEFAVILWELASPADAKVAAMSIAMRMQKPLRLDHGEYQTGVSVGVAVYPEDGTTAEQLLAHADQKMYADKARSKSLSLPSQDAAPNSA